MTSPPDWPNDNFPGFSQETYGGTEGSTERERERERRRERGERDAEREGRWDMGSEMEEEERCEKTDFNAQKLTEL